MLVAVVIRTRECIRHSSFVIRKVCDPAAAPGRSNISLSIWLACAPPYDTVGIVMVPGLCELTQL